MRRQAGGTAAPLAQSERKATKPRDEGLRKRKNLNVARSPPSENDRQDSDNEKHTRNDSDE